MDILIKGMEMPSCCEECPFMKKVCDIYFTDKKTGVKTPYHYVDSCSLTGSWFDPFSDDSPKPCPLVALPEHGRLISESDIASLIIADIQRLETTDEYTDKEKELVREVYQSCLYKLGITPTIVEATE